MIAVETTRRVVSTVYPLSWGIRPAPPPRRAYFLGRIPCAHGRTTKNGNRRPTWSERNERQRVQSKTGGRTAPRLRPLGAALPKAFASENESYLRSRAPHQTLFSKQSLMPQAAPPKTKIGDSRGLSGASVSERSRRPVGRSALRLRRPYRAPPLSERKFYLRSRNPCLSGAPQTMEIAPQGPLRRHFLGGL